MIPELSDAVQWEATGPVTCMSIAHPSASGSAREPPQEELFGLCTLLPVLVPGMGKGCDKHQLE